MARRWESAHADASIARMDALGVDYTQLLALRHWEWLDHTDFGRRLKQFAEMQLGLTRREAASEAFHWRVDAVFRERGVTPLAPARRVEAYRKEELFAQHRAARWPEPHTPYLVQMRPGVFILFASWRDGFLAVRDMTASGMYRTKDGRLLDVALVYEGQVVGVPARIILDCEARVEAEFGGRMTRAELEANVRRVPETLVRALVRMGALRGADVARFYVKNKSRGDKVSFHFVSNILVEPTVDGRNALRRAFVDGFEEARAQGRRTKSMVHAVRADGTCAPELHVDASTLHGRNQFSCVFSRKAGERPCVIEARLDIRGDGAAAVVVEHRSALAGEDHVPTHPRALDMLWFGGFAHWIAGTVTLDTQMRVGPTMTEAKIGGGEAPSAARRVASASGGGPGAASSLPQWMKSAATSTAYSENTGMGTLRDRHARLSKYVPGLALEDVIHVRGGCFCPVLTLYGAPRIHSSNGVYVALQRREGSGEVAAVYASCPNCKFESKKMGGKEGVMVDIVPGLENSRHPWVVYTEETYARIAAAAASGAGKAASTTTTLLHSSSVLHKKKTAEEEEARHSSNTTTATHPAQARKRLKKSE